MGKIGHPPPGALTIGVQTWHHSFDFECGNVVLGTARLMDGDGINVCTQYTHVYLDIGVTRPEFGFLVYTPSLGWLRAGNVEKINNNKNILFK